MVVWFDMVLFVCEMGKVMERTGKNKKGGLVSCCFFFFSFKIKRKGNICVWESSCFLEEWVGGAGSLLGL